MPQHVLNDEIHHRIIDLCAQGDSLAEELRFAEAFGCYRDALGLVPQPAEDWEATTWILAAIGDLYFQEEKIEKALAAFEDAVHCPGGLGNPFIHLRLGQCSFDLGKMDRAADELTRAYMGAGREIFEADDPKYLRFLETKIKLPASDHDSDDAVQ
jgi:tetratricopeptide (TPR) repeat protein